MTSRVHHVEPEFPFTLHISGSSPIFAIICFFLLVIFIRVQLSYLFSVDQLCRFDLYTAWKLSMFFRSQFGR